MSAILRKTTVAIGLLALGAVSACGGTKLVLPADSAGTELFQQSQGLMEQEKWSKAAEGYDTYIAILQQPLQLARFRGSLHVCACFSPVLIALGLRNLFLSEP